MVLLITNNPMVIANFKSRSKISSFFIDGNHFDVLLEARNQVHSNFRLLTHPISGSVKPNETPFKSIALIQDDHMDVDSLIWIENAIETYFKLQKDRETPQWIDSVQEDFMVIDLDLIENALPNYLYL